MKATTQRILLTAVLAAFAGAVQAADVKLSCEKRTTRSRVSVDGEHLKAGTYFAVVTSGANTVTTPMATATRSEVEFDLDSNTNDIAEGAVAIAATFIVDGRVSAEVRDAAGNVVASGSATCRVRR